MVIDGIEKECPDCKQLFLAESDSDTRCFACAEEHLIDKNITDENNE